jgi:hypothetical protein
VFLVTAVLERLVVDDAGMEECDESKILLGDTLQPSSLVHRLAMTAARLLMHVASHIMFALCTVLE